MTRDQIDEMAAELQTLAPAYSQHEALMRARWGGDFDADGFGEACALAEAEEDEEDEEARS